MDSDGGTMCWMVMINGDDMIMDDITAVSLTAPEVTTLPDYTLGRQSADFHVTE